MLQRNVTCDNILVMKYLSKKVVILGILFLASVATIVGVVTPYLLRLNNHVSLAPQAELEYVYIDAFHYSENIWIIDGFDELAWVDYFFAFNLGDGLFQLMKPCREPVNQNFVGMEFRLVNCRYLYILSLRWGS